MRNTKDINLSAEQRKSSVQANADAVRKANADTVREADADTVRKANADTVREANADTVCAADAGLEHTVVIGTIHILGV